MDTISFKFLVDINLPKHFSFFNFPHFAHVRDIKSFLSSPKPKVVHFQLHNFTLSELHNYFSANWEKIISLLDSASLVVAKKDSIKIVF